MSLTTLIDKVLGKQREREQARAADFQSIVRQIAAGKEPDADRVDDVLADAGKTLDDLRQAVERLQTRSRLRERIDELPKIAAEREQIEKQIAAADQVLADAERTHDEVTAPLIARMAELREASWTAQSAKAELLRTCLDPGLLDQMEDTESQLKHWRRNAAELRDVINDHRDRARIEQDRAEQAKRIVRGEEQVKEHLENAKRHERTVAGCEAQLVRAEKEIAKLERQQETIREQMLVP